DSSYGTEDRKFYFVKNALTVDTDNLNWAAPEIMQENAYYTWLAYQKILYKEKSNGEIISHVTKGGREDLNIESSNIPEEYIKIIQEGWKHKAEERIKMDEVSFKLLELENKLRHERSNQLSNFIDVFNLTRNVNLNHGLIINTKKIRPSDFSACIFKIQPNITELHSRKFQAKLVLSSEYKDSFLLENHIDSSAINTKYLEWMNDANPLKNNSVVKDVYLEIQSPQVELIFRKELIKPSEKLVIAIKNALNHQNPYRELMKVFNTYGYFLPERVILGYKLYVMSNLITDKDSSESDVRNDEWTIDDFSLAKYEEFFNKWGDHIKSYNFNSSYLISIDGDIVTRDKIKEWANNFLGNDDQTINSIIKAKVLMTGLYGKLMTQDGIPINNIVVEFKSMNIYGFSATIESFNTSFEVNIENLQIIWILIGVPSEIGIYCPDTRNISILCLDNYAFVPKMGCNTQDPCFRAEIKNYDEGIDVTIHIKESKIMDNEDKFTDVETTFKSEISSKIMDNEDKFTDVETTFKSEISSKIMDNEDKFTDVDTTFKSDISSKIMDNEDKFTDVETTFKSEIASKIMDNEDKFTNVETTFKSEVSSNNDYSDETSNASVELEYSFQCHLQALGQSIRQSGDMKNIISLENITHLGLDLSYNKLDSKVGKTLLNALKRNKVTNLDLSYNNINIEMGKALVEVLQTNTTLTQLNLKSTKIQSETVIDLVKILKSKIPLNDLDLSHIKLNSKAGMTLTKVLENNETLSKLNLSNNDIDLSFRKALVTVLEKNKSLVNLDLSFNNLETEVIVALAKALGSNSKLTHLNLCFINPEFRAEIALAKALETNKTLVSLNLSLNKIGSFEERSLKDHLQKSFSNLTREENIINCVTGKHFKIVLEKNKTLTDLNISSNNISSEAGKTLIDALKHNKTLRKLNLSKNNIGPEAGKRLVGILKTNKALTTINLGSTRIGPKTLDLSHNDIDPKE
ncbi:23960_t:CDS:2, partial [Racocetra persica]